MTLAFLPPAAPAAPAGEGRGSTPFRYRGLYVESTWGPDLMTLEDWCHLVDEMAGLDLNSLGVGVYGCWGVQYDSRRTEFLMVPFPEHPRLETPRTISWYSPTAGAERSLTYRPRMFDGDFLGALVAYGRERGVAVRPHFNGPGHSTLIPTLFPEVSARGEDGLPTGFGYCLSSEATYRLLCGLYDSLIARHLRPNGGVWWHLGLDEVEAQRGIDEADPQRLVDPWCRCPACAAESRPRLLVRFAMRSIEHLVGEGIEQITLWHDALARLEAFPLLAQTLTARGLRDRVAVQWWRYSDPPLAVGERALRSWVTPIAGYWSNLFHHDYGANIAAMAAAGAAAGSEGLDAYCTFDPAFFRSYALLATLGRHPQTDPAAFRAAYNAWLFEGQPVPPAFEHFDRLFDSSYGPLGELLDSLLHYWWTFPDGRHVSYPRDQVAQVAADPLRLGRTLAATHAQAGALRAACLDAAPRAPDDRRRRLLREYAAEAHKLEGVTGAVRHAAGAWNHHRAARRAATRYETVEGLTRARAALQTARQAVADVMADLESTKAPFLRPHALRELTPLYRWLSETHDQVREWQDQVAAGGLDDLPAL